MPEETLAERAKRRKAERGLVVVPEAPQDQMPEFDADLIPEVEPYEQSPEDEQLDGILNGISIVDAYTKWCGKSAIPNTNRTEGIKVSCPNPDHPDTDPSAWLNTDKDVYFCGGCQVGGDKYDIAAFHFGYSVPEYKKNGTFPELRRKMGHDLGFMVARTVGGAAYVVPIAPEPEAAPAEPTNVVKLPIPEEMLYEEMPGLPWRDLFPKDTFMGTWMEATCVDDLPDEYYVWLGLMGLGFAAGENAILLDRPPVKPNLFVCLYGPSGIGKSKASNTFVRLLRDALPYDYDDPTSTGAMIGMSPGSPEALIDSFCKEIPDPNDPTKAIGRAHVRGLVRFDELSTLIGRASRLGSAFKPVLMEFYDAYGDLTHHTRGHGRVVAEKPFAQLLTTTQPTVIRELLTQQDADAGFVNRWVFAAGPMKPLTPYGGIELDLRQSVTALSAVRAWASLGHTLTMDPDALDLWSSWFHATIEPIKKNGSVVLSRLDLTLKKIMLLLAINEKRTVIDKKIVERALMFFPYLQVIYSTISSSIGIGQFEDCRQAIAKVIVDQQNSTGVAPSARDLTRYISKRYARDMVAKVLKVMIELGEVEEEVNKPKTGRPTTRYKYVG